VALARESQPRAATGTAAERELALRPEMEEPTMRAMLTLIAIVGASIAVSAAHAAGRVPSLVGWWHLHSECVRIGDPSNPGLFDVEDHNFVIEEQQGPLFWGYTPGVTCAVDKDPGCNTFYGVIDGREVRVTAWDGITVGTLGKGGREIRFTSQNQQWNPGSAPAACTGLAERL
jgi:hypothetical protein